eukprot:620182-Hanusia_phi.AAC.2
MRAMWGDRRDVLIVKWNCAWWVYAALNVPTRKGQVGNREVQLRDFRRERRGEIEGRNEVMKIDVGRVREGDRSAREKRIG